MTGKSALAYFGGTFDPVHIGHVNLVVRLKEIAQVDKVLVAPSPYTPHKKHELPIASIEHRKRMLEIAFQNVSGVEIQVLEEGEGPFYLVDTAKKHLPSGTTLFFGEDVLENIGSWKNVKELFALAKPLIGTRNHEGYDLPEGELGALLREAIVPIAAYSISSTEIRERLANKNFCEHMVPGKVLDYIYENSIYSH